MSKFQAIARSLIVTVCLVSAIAFAEKTLKSYDFFNPKSRYQWYLDMREYINKNGGLKCIPSPDIQTSNVQPVIKLKVMKDGKFTIDNLKELPGNIFMAGGNTIEDCANSVEVKHFPLPPNTPMDSVTFLIRPGNSKPLSKTDLDETVFKIIGDDKD